MVPSPEIFAWGMPLHAHVSSLIYHAVVRPQFRHVHLNKQAKVFRYLSLMKQNNQNKRRLHKI